jgi:hypothetical protein
LKKSPGTNSSRFVGSRAAGRFDDLREVEDDALHPRVRADDRPKQVAFAGAHINDPPVLGEIVGGEDVGNLHGRFLCHRLTEHRPLIGVGR